MKRSRRRRRVACITARLNRVSSPCHEVCVSPGRRNIDVTEHIHRLQFSNGLPIPAVRVAAQNVRVRTNTGIGRVGGTKHTVQRKRVSGPYETSYNVFDVKKNTISIHSDDRRLVFVLLTIALRN